MVNLSQKSIKISRLYQDRELRKSYVVWQEEVHPEALPALDSNRS
ncbi:hypothetical protein PMG71_00275 [Roseofilum sp. BLCC_M154]|uniref:Uncharacterized protein n=1 Tax=Roseofilum acuticapitatum BLCC-M154 TaxID=3022444 RepID=A0ABT7ANF7_9CYAN|nr:hypothetical protein [Roseofilum acuticapitatum]MDJ1167856.1 hypothetical protein [Roseofilum acuticapitatum BLCC-M154]